jgi:hypothetical protein
MGLGPRIKMRLASAATYGVCGLPLVRALTGAASLHTSELGKGAPRL